MQEEELKGRVAETYFGDFDTKRIIGRIDFCVCQRMPKDAALFGVDIQCLLWAEAKQGTKYDVYDSLVQLVLTIGKARTHRMYIPPKWLAAFDEEKIAFVPFEDICDVLEQNDFNWNVAPSDHGTREFAQLRGIVGKSLEEGTRLFYYEADNEMLREFIRTNIGTGEMLKIRVDKNNFMSVYDMWCKVVKPTIDVDWDAYNRKLLIMSADFFLADLMSADDITMVDKLRVLLNHDIYRVKYNVVINDIPLQMEQSVRFTDNQKAHRQFWNIFERPPKRGNRDHIIDRRDLLVPQDIRERKGAYFTPQKWVRLSQQYIAKTLGEEWQSEYYIWDCCAGTGNLLAGLTNKKNIFASTIDQADVEIMKELATKGLPLEEKHIFQFDFLNDEFSEAKLPKKLYRILKEEQERLIIYINPPYAEADNRKGIGRSGVAESIIHSKYDAFMGYARREIYIQFLTRIYNEIDGCRLYFFSKLKNIQAPRFVDFRNNFKAKLENMFLMPANTFDNVSGAFPIAFQMWNSSKKIGFKSSKADVFDKDGIFTRRKVVRAYDKQRLINDWAKTFRKDDDTPKSIATIIAVGSDFQNQRLVRIVEPYYDVPADNHHWQITKENLLESCVYFSARHCANANWENDREQFLYPNNKWKKDTEFQTDCLVFTLFHGQNRISCADCTNHWIPFDEDEVGQDRDDFTSHFMYDFIHGNKITDPSDDDWNNRGGGGKDKGRYTARKSKGKKANGVVPYMFYDGEEGEDMQCVGETCEEYGYGEDYGKDQKGLVFSEEAKAVMDAGRELWRYYHKQAKAMPDASFYDIRRHFQGANESGKMNSDSKDERYMELIGELRERMRRLGKKIEERVWDYEFLK